MTPTSPADAPAASTPDNDDRTRRNVACVNCRNSKVRCRASHVLGQPCQRCAKLHLSCVVDKSHKRVTKRSKLEQLEQELKSIKQVVQPSPASNGDSHGTNAWTPPSPRATFTALPDQRVGSAAGVRHTPQVPTPQPESTRSTHGSERRAKITPTEARMIGNHVVSGEDLDWYFAKYLNHFHQFIPILRRHDPDECFDTCPTLFWVVVFVAARRYPRDGAIFSMLVDHLSKDIWSMTSTTVLNLDNIHALLILCCWPLPTIRFMSDPSNMLSSVAMNTAMLLGCHTGKGKNPQFLVGLRQNMQSTDEEASSTWLAACLLTEKTMTSVGMLPPNIQYNDTRPKEALDSPAWIDLLALYECQRFLNRFHNAIAAQVTPDGTFRDTTVAMWETEFESLKPLLIRYDTEISNFCMAATQLEIQLGYFLTPPDTSTGIKAHAVRVFNSARALISLAVELESRSQFLTHAPLWGLRALVDATGIIIAILHSACAPGIPDHDADMLIRQACGAILRCSVRETDLPHRVSVIMETYWSVRHLVPSMGVAPGARTERLVAGVTFWFLRRFHTGLQAAQSKTDRVNKALEMSQSNKNLPPAADTTNGQTQGVQMISDPIQDVDWSIFMDDFGWTGDESVLLGLP